MIVALPYGIVVEPRDPVENADAPSGLTMIRLSAAEAIVVVHNQLGLLGLSRDRERSVLGRLYNRIIGEETEFLDMAGSTIAQLLGLAGDRVPSGLRNDVIYRVRHRDARGMKERAERQFADGC